MNDLPLDVMLEIFKRVSDTALESKSDPNTMYALESQSGSKMMDAVQPLRQTCREIDGQYRAIEPYLLTHALRTITQDEDNFQLALSEVEIEVGDLPLWRSTARSELVKIALANHSHFARFAKFAVSLYDHDGYYYSDVHLGESTKDPFNGGIIRFTQSYDKVQAEKAIYLYATRGYSEGTKAEVAQRCEENGWDACKKIYLSLERFIRATVTGRIGIEEVPQNTRFLSPLERLAQVLVESKPQLGTWRLLGLLRGVWGPKNYAIDAEYFERKEEREPCRCRGNDQNCIFWSTDQRIEDCVFAMNRFLQGPIDNQVWFPANIAVSWCRVVVLGVKPEEEEIRLWIKHIWENRDTEHENEDSEKGCLITQSFNAAIDLQILDQIESELESELRAITRTRLGIY